MFKLHAPSRLLAALSVTAALTALSACTTTNPDVIQPGEAQRLSNVEDAVVLSVRPVVVEGSQSGMGSAAGAVAGGVAGSSVGGSREAVVVGVLGAVAGAVVGNAAERFGTRESAVEIILQTPNGQRRSIVQAQGKEQFEPGDPVLLVRSGGKVRAIKALPPTP